jgi:hypothetical protein
VPLGSQFALHEATPPTNGVAASDVTIIVQAGTIKTINNTAASVAATPRPSTPVLATTGGGGNPMLPWPALLLGALLVAAGAGLLRRRRAA